MNKLYTNLVHVMLIIFGLMLILNLTACDSNDELSAHNKPVKPLTWIEEGEDESRTAGYRGL